MVVYTYCTDDGLFRLHFKSLVGARHTRTHAGTHFLDSSNFKKPGVHLGSVHYIFYVLIQLVRCIVLALTHVHVLLLHSDYNVLYLMQGCLKQATVIMIRQLL